MTKPPTSFPPEIENFIHEICANAILRAAQNGTLDPAETETETETEAAAAAAAAKDEKEPRD